MKSVETINELREELTTLSKKSEEQVFTHSSALLSLKYIHRSYIYDFCTGLAYSSLFI